MTIEIRAQIAARAVLTLWILAIAGSSSGNAQFSCHDLDPECHDARRITRQADDIARKRWEFVEALNRRLAAAHAARHIQIILIQYQQMIAAALRQLNTLCQSEDKLKQCLSGSYALKTYVAQQPKTTMSRLRLSIDIAKQTAYKEATQKSINDFTKSMMELNELFSKFYDSVLTNTTTSILNRAAAEGRTASVDILKRIKCTQNFQLLIHQVSLEGLAALEIEETSSPLLLTLHKKKIKQLSTALADYKKICQNNTTRINLKIEKMRSVEYPRLIRLFDQNSERICRRVKERHHKLCERVLSNGGNDHEIAFVHGLLAESGR